MKEVKYLDIKHELTGIDEILAESLNEKRLNIAQLNHKCEKFKKIVIQKPALKTADYVVYSKLMKDHHNEEMFLFLDNNGKTVETAHGDEFWLYNMIKECEVLENEENMVE